MRLPSCCSRRRSWRSSSRSFFGIALEAPQHLFLFLLELLLREEAVAVGLAGHALGAVLALLVGLVLVVASVVALLLRCVRRLGGITGDVLGAVVEVSFAVLVLAAATV